MERVLDLDGRVKTLTLGPSTTTYPDFAQAWFESRSLCYPQRYAIL